METGGIANVAFQTAYQARAASMQNSAAREEGEQALALIQSALATLDPGVGGNLDLLV